jgi:ANTAR domain/GAF domain
VSDLDASAGVVSLMTRAGYRAATVATDNRARRLDEDQFTLGEGPALDAFDTSSAVLAGNLREQPWPTRWPLFVPAAQRLSMQAALSFPLLAGTRSLGVMTVYGAEPVRMDEQRLSRAQDTAERVTMTLLGGPQGTLPSDRNDGSGHRGTRDGATRPGPAPSDTTEEVPMYRAEIYQASGMIMAQLSCSIEEAMIRLRAYAFAHDRPLHEVARQVVDRQLRFDPDE